MLFVRLWGYFVKKRWLYHLVNGMYCIKTNVKCTAPAV